MTDKEKEKERRFGRYAVKEHTARRLVVAGQQRPLVAVGLMWAIFVPIVLLVGPWRGGTPLYIVLTSALVLAIVSLLILRFVPRRQEFAIDIDAGNLQYDQAYLLRLPQAAEVELGAVVGVRCRRQFWRDMPGVEAARWVVEILGQEEHVWRLAEEKQEAPMRDLARLVAEVSGRPLLAEE